MTRVTTWTEVTELDGTESLAIDDGSNKKLLAENTLCRVASSSATQPNFSVRPADNSIDSAANTSQLIAGSDSFPCKIGAASKPVGTDNTNPAAWANDTGYVSGAASVAAIVGGYDHINNQLAGTIVGGGHNYIESNVGGHSVITGGSYNWINASRSAILGGTDNRITGASTGKCSIVCGKENRIEDGEYSAILAGLENRSNSSGSHNLQSGNANDLSGSVSYVVQIGQTHTLSGGSGSIQIGGDNNTRTAGRDGAAIAGSTNTQSGARSVILGGEGCDDNGSIGAVLSGKDGLGIFSENSHVTGCTKLSTQGDSQIFDVVQNVQTTGSDSNPPSAMFIELDDAKTTVITCTVHVTAWNETTSEEAGWIMDAVIFWNGTTYRINGSTSEPEMTAIYNAGAIDNPKLAANTGSFRLRFQGMAAETINYCARISGTMAVKT